MKYVLVKTEYNWADEINLPGWEVMSKGDFEDCKKVIKDYWKNGGKKFDIYVGTNEGITFYSESDCIPFDSDVIEITETDFEVVNRLFGSSSGKINFSRIVERIEEE